VASASIPASMQLHIAAIVPDEMFRFNDWINERILELLKYFRIFGYHIYLMCNSTRHSNVFNNLITLMPPDQPDKLYAASPILAMSQNYATSPLHYIMGIA